MLPMMLEGAKVIVSLPKERLVPWPSSSTPTPPAPECSLLLYLSMLASAWDRLDSKSVPPLTPPTPRAERRDAEACRLTSLFDKDELSIIDRAACCNGEIIVRSDGKKWHTEDGVW